MHTNILTGVTLDHQAAIPISRQIYQQVRARILTGQLAPGTRLPATRKLAATLSVSRNTVMLAFDQLLAEGYLYGKVGSGTYVTPALPDEMLNISQFSRDDASIEPGSRLISRRGERLASVRVSGPQIAGEPRPFHQGIPDYRVFPFDIWGKLAQRHLRSPSLATLGYNDPAGYMPLRTAIASYANDARATRCTPEQIIIISGSQQGIALSAQILLDPGDAAWIEDPGYRGARAALEGAGALVIPVPLDSEGLNITAGQAACPDPRLIYVTPSHQYPLGITMSVARRLVLLEWANNHTAWIIEDDYDSEYRYVGRPLESLQGLDQQRRVIYVGTFSKMLFPALRLGYLIVPTDLVDIFLAARALYDRRPPQLEQAILADFIVEGHFARHIRRMRTLYSERQSVLVMEARRLLGDRLYVPAHDSGMHLIGWLPPGTNDSIVSQQAADIDVDVTALSSHAMQMSLQPGLLLGYAALDREQIYEGLTRLARVL
jgi:GntR family transcriptional regulator / MocR family aminotransferase